MSDSDSSIPQKVAALAIALEAVCQHIGFYSPLDLSFYSWLEATDPDRVPWDPDPSDARKEVLAAAVELLEVVDTAVRMLNAVPVSVLKPLSKYSDSVRWDVRTRRTLKELQATITDLPNDSTYAFVGLSIRNLAGEAEVDEMRSKLKGFLGEIKKRIFDLSCLPDDRSGRTNPTTILEDPTKTDDKPPKKKDESPPPKYDPNSKDWILSEILCKVIGIKAATITEYRKPRKCGDDRTDEFGSWNIDCVGTFRRNVNSKRGVAYYRPSIVDAYTAKLTYAESQKAKET